MWQLISIGFTSFVGKTQVYKHPRHFMSKQIIQNHLGCLKKKSAIKTTLNQYGQIISMNLHENFKTITKDIYCLVWNVIITNVLENIFRNCSGVRIQTRNLVFKAESEDNFNFRILLFNR